MKFPNRPSLALAQVLHMFEAIRTDAPCDLLQGITDPKERQEQEISFSMARELHQGQVRTATGRPYVDHCIQAFVMGKDCGLPHEARIALALHDGLEHGPENTSESQQSIANKIGERFGSKVAALVWSMTDEDGDLLPFEKIERAKMMTGLTRPMKAIDKICTFSDNVVMPPPPWRERNIAANIRYTAEMLESLQPVPPLVAEAFGFLATQMAATWGPDVIPPDVRQKPDLRTAHTFS
jgi:hypothetical protein